MSEVKRDSSGRFPKGTSGNRKGRTPKYFEPSPRLPASRRREIMEVADHMVEVNVDGRKQKMTLYKASAYALGIAAAKGDRVAAARFLDLNMRISEIDFERQVTAHQYRKYVDRLQQENEELRQKAGGQSSGVVIDTELWQRYQDQRLDGDATVAALIGQGSRADEDDEDPTT